MVRISAWCRPHDLFQASEISPRVARAWAAVHRQFQQVALARSRRTRSGPPGPRRRPRRPARPCSCSSRATCWRRTSVLSTSRISRGSSLSSRYLLTPTMISWPESMWACRRAAASSMRILGSPALMAAAMPPCSSTSWMWSQALCISSSVRLSRYQEPPQGSTVRQMPVSSCR